MTELVLNTVPGTHIVSDPAIAFKRVLKVARVGKGFDILRTGDPVGRQVLKRPWTGKLEFDPTIPFSAGETVYVLYKE